MRIYKLTTKLDKEHDVPWIARYLIEHREVPRPEDATLWKDEEWSLPALAEDGPWIKLCGVNVAELSGKTVRVTVEVAEDGAPDLAAVGERAVEAVEEYTAKWSRSRTRDGDSEFMSGARFGWAGMMARILGRGQSEVREALERGEMR